MALRTPITPTWWWSPTLHSYIGTDYFLTLPSLDQIPAFYKLGLSELTPELSIQILDDAKERLAAAEALFG